MSAQVIKGAEGLAKIVGLRNLVPSLNVIDKIINAMKEGGMLDAAAQKAFAGLIASYASATPQAVEKLAEVYAKHRDTLDKNASDRLQDQWISVMRLDCDSALKEKLALQAQRNIHEHNMQGDKIVGDIAKIGILTLGGALLAVAAGAAYQRARPPTFIESIFGKR